MKGFILLLSFMTRLFVPKVEYDEEKLGRAMKFFPLVGFIISLFLYLTAITFFKFTFNTGLTVIFVILIEVILTGGLHLDGLADTFDGIFSYRSKQKMLEIMKDSRIGTNGVLALIMYFLIKFFLLEAIIQQFGLALFFFAIISYPIVARLCSVISCASAPYARSSGMGKTFVDNTNKRSVVFSFILTIILISLPLFLILDPVVYLDTIGIMSIVLILIVSFMALVATLFSKLITRKIGGITGDTLGALLELSEILYLLILIIIVYNSSFYF